MDTDDLEPQKKKPKPRNLDEMSVEALHEYILEMEAEVTRVRDAIVAKEGARVSADSVFKK